MLVSGRMRSLVTILRNHDLSLLGRRLRLLETTTFEGVECEAVGVS